MNYYMHHIGDYLRDTAHLTIIEHGAYRRMLDLYYASEKPLPLDVNWLCRLIRAEETQAQDAVHFVLQHYFKKFEDGWHNKRADEEIKSANKKAKAARVNGKLGGRPKTHPVSVGLAKHNLGTTHAETQAKAPSNHYPATNNQKKEEAKLPPDGGSTVWDFGKALLAEQGLSKSSAGALIGSWLREWDEPTVADALRSAAGKADARGYVAAILKAKAKRSDGKAELKVAMP